MVPQLVLLPVAVGDTWLAIDAAHVREIAAATEMTAIPGGPSGLSGVLPWRGKAVAVLDLAPILGMPPLDGMRSRLIIAEVGPDAVALPVDRVREARVADGVRPAHAVRMPHCSCEVDVEGRPLPLFDLHAWLSSLAGESL